MIRLACVVLTYSTLAGATLAAALTIPTDGLAVLAGTFLVAGGALKAAEVTR
jgi:hypothetical protein